MVPMRGFYWLSVLPLSYDRHIQSL